MPEKASQWVTKGKFIHGKPFAARKAQAANVLDVMLKEGLLLKVTADLCFDSKAIGKLRSAYKDLLVKTGKADPAGFKELTGLSRKFIIPLMEYFDMTKLTIRAGEYRILRDKADNN